MRKTWLVIGATLLSCGDEGSGGAGAGANSRIAQRLRECGLLGQEGNFARERPLRAENVQADDVCVADCLQGASCDELRASWCEASSALLDKCLGLCGLFSTCADGSADDALRCDGIRDCDDGSDETDCESELFFDCPDGQSFPPYYKCDGEMDCSDGADERGCDPSAQFRCGSGEQIPKDYECDTQPDCEDGSDERRCVARGLLFQCGSGELVSKQEVCDLFENCEDGSDEAQHCADLMCAP